MTKNMQKAGEREVRNGRRATAGWESTRGRRKRRTKRGERKRKEGEGRRECEERERGLGG